MTYVEPPDDFQLQLEDSTFVDVIEKTLPHALQRAIMPVVLHRRGALEVAGTAFSIMPNVALTAAHVVADAGGARSEGAGLLYIGGTYANGGLMGGLLPIYQLNLDTRTDLALLRYELPEIDGAQLRTKHLPLDFREPKEGDVCLAIGYTVGFQFDGDHLGGAMSISPKLHASRGKVEEVHREGRPMLPYPVFRMSAHIASQMSGSPVLSGGVGRQSVVGLVTSSYDLEEGATPISYGSLLGSALDLHLTFKVDDVERELTLREMVEREHVTAIMG